MQGYSQGDKMTNDDVEALEGTTLSVYAVVVKEGRPVGPRDVMRGANLSSPSVAYRQLQKLENLGLVEKNEYGEYLVKQKIGVSGHLWFRGNLIPRLLFYSFFFLGILGAEATLIGAMYFFRSQLPGVELLFVTFITAVAMTMFLVEGIILMRKKPK